MFAAIQFRLCLSLIPVMLSIPLAWKVHETKILNTIHDQEINAKTFFEELEGVDETPVEHSTFDDIMTTGIEGKEIMDIDSNKEEEEIIQADKILDDVSIINEDLFDINHFLGINFRMENNFTLTDSTSVLKDSWFVVKLKSYLRNIQEMILSSIYKIANYIKTQLGIGGVNFNIFGMFGLLSLRCFISSCSIYALKLLLIPVIKCLWMLRSFGFYLHRLAHRIFFRNKRKVTTTVDFTSAALPNSLSNIKDPESVSPSRASVDNVWDQAAMFDEKKNSKGFKERNDADSSEWLESSFIEGGIQTFSMAENENGRSMNKTEDYLQFSGAKNTERKNTEMVFKDPPRTSTPKKFTNAEKVPRAQMKDIDMSSTYSPQKLRNFLYSKCEQERGLELTLGLSKLTYSQFIVVDEQKKLKDRDDNSLRLNYFVNSTKNKIRRRLMNMSNV